LLILPALALRFGRFEAAVNELGENPPEVANAYSTGE